jgi:tetratricopeptide (TPR) repeat protein
MSDEHTVICLRSLVQRYLTSNIIEAASFYAERLFYECPTDESQYLLSLCYFRGGKYKQAYLILQSCKTAHMCKYLFALCCDKLDKWHEGETILKPAGARLSDSVDKLALDAVRSTPGGAEGVYLLGRFCRKQHRKEMAVMYYRLSLQLDPYLWCAVTELSDLGVPVDMAELLHCDKSASYGDPRGKGDGHVLRSADPLHPHRMSGWLQETKDASAEECYSAHSVFRDSHQVERRRAAEQLASRDGQPAGAPPRVSMALGMSSMSLHVPFASPGGMPSPLMATQQSMLGGDVSSFNSTALASGGFQSVPLDSSRGGSETGNRSEFSRGQLQDARAALFGMGTPGLTPMSISAAPLSMSTAGVQGAMRGAAPHTDDTAHSGIKGVHLFGDSAPNSTALPGGAAQGRRVSFGPTARLSFSGALDAGGHGHHGPLGVMQSFEEDSAQFGGADGSPAGEDGYPFKAPRADPHASSPSSGGHRTSETSSRALPHKLMLSPFPVESSPIPQHGAGGPGDSMVGGTSAFIGEPFASPSTASRKFVGGRVTPSTATAAGPTDQQNKENGPGASAYRREGPSAGIAAVDDTFLGRDSPGADGAQPDDGELGSRHLADTRALNHLVATFARAYQMLCTYCCRACINELQTQLPERHFRSGLVSQWVGKAFYEMNEYKSAVVAFREMLRVEPFRLYGLETLSTALWHLKRDKELSALAQQVVEVDKLCPETWCVVGNCFSLQKEPDTAIKFFTRALQLDPTFPYAYTLCGHEQVNNEDMDKAVESFRLAVLHNDRHYNAWYGLGSIYFRQEKYELAEYHFRTALSINPASSVLHCYLGACLQLMYYARIHPPLTKYLFVLIVGMALHAQNNVIKTTEALDVLTSAAQKDVDNPQVTIYQETLQ